MNRPSLSSLILLARHASFWGPFMGQGPTLWVFVTLMNLLTQIFLRRELAPGEFGITNAVLGLVGLMIVPLLAFQFALTEYLVRPSVPERIDYLLRLRLAFLALMEMATLAWGGVALVLLCVLLPWLALPRLALNVFTLLSIFFGISALLSGVFCQEQNQTRLWAWLVGGAALLRLVVSGFLALAQPWAESATAALVFAGVVTLVPLLREHTVVSNRIQALSTLLDRELLIRIAATVSVFLALFLFSSADRIVAQGWFGTPENNNISYINWRAFDNYQTAGLLARALLWGTQPLLWILFSQRAPLARTHATSLTFFWIYLGALAGGAILLVLFGPLLSWIFCGDFHAITSLLPSFALAMISLGFVSGLGVFSLASRRYPECFTLGACSIGYTLVLIFAGRQPELMISYMFGGALVTAMVVLFLGIVRWGRKQP